MGEYRHIAGRIAENALEGGLSVEQLFPLLSKIIPGPGKNAGAAEINCYPGLPGNLCYDFALFISLNGKLLRRGRRWPYTFPKILEELIQHFQGRCPGITKEAVLITDTWESLIYEKWAPNIAAIKAGGVHLEIYLIGVGLTRGVWVTEIPC